MVAMQILSVRQSNFLLYIKVTTQCLHVFLERFQSDGRDAADGAGLLALEGLLDLDVSRRRELVYLHAEVARRGSRLLLDIWGTRLPRR